MLFGPKTTAALSALVITAVLCAGPSWGQDTHYWTDQYGARSMLLSGAVIGSVNDMSAVFYNPGALGYLAKPQLVLSASAYQARSLKVEDEGGRGVNLGSSSVNLIPNLVAGSFRFKFHGSNKLAYSVLSRYRFQADVRTNRIGEADLNPELPGEENYAAGLASGTHINDVWVGLTWARSIGDHLGLGVTTFFSARSQKILNELLLQVEGSTPDVSLLSAVNNYNAHMYSLLWKVGVGFNHQPFTAGLTLTTPNLRVAGSGDAVVNETNIGIDLDGDGIPDDAFVTDVQQNAKANYRSPLSIGFGAAWYPKNSRFHISVEWFSAVGAYDMLELQPFTSQRTGQTVQRQFQQELSSVFNVALGLEHTFSSTYSAYLGFNTNNSAYNPASDVSMTTYDILHGAIGVKASLEKVRFTLGLGYAWGSDTLRQRSGLGASGDASVSSSLNELNMDFAQWTLILGFALDI